MKISLFTLGLFILLSAVQLNAGSIPFRSGKILAAELTTRKITVYGVPAEMPINIPNNPVYAVVSIKLENYRSISIFDYTLEASGTQFPCIAISTQEKFIHNDAPVNSSGVVQLLFIADSLTAAKMQSESHVLKCKLTPGEIFDVKIPFSNIGSSAPKAIRNIPAEGIIVVKTSSEAK